MRLKCEFQQVHAPNLPACQRVEIEQWTENVLLLKKDNSRGFGTYPICAESSPCKSGGPMRDICAIPRGFRPSAQGGAPAPTLGSYSEAETTPIELWPRPGARAR